MKLRSPTRISHGIRSSYELSRLFGHEPLATVREIPAPSHTVVSKRGVLVARWNLVTP